MKTKQKLNVGKNRNIFFYMLNAAVIGKKKVVSDFDKGLNK